MSYDLAPNTSTHFNDFDKQGTDFNKKSQKDNDKITGEMLKDLQSSTFSSMKTTTESSQLALMAKLNEAMGKILKALGQAVASMF